MEGPLEVNAREALRCTTRDKSPRTSPLTIGPEAYVARAVNIMEKHIVTTLVVTRTDDKPIGLIRWIDLSMAGVV